MDRIDRQERLKDHQRAIILARGELLSKLDTHAEWERPSDEAAAEQPVSTEKDNVDAYLPTTESTSLSSASAIQPESNSAAIPDLVQIRQELDSIHDAMLGEGMAA